MVREAHRTVYALGYPSTVFTIYDRGVAPPILKNDHLLFSLQRIAYCCEQHAGELALDRLQFSLFAHVGHNQRGKLASPKRLSSRM